MKRIYFFVFCTAILLPLLFTACDRKPITPENTQKKKIARIVEEQIDDESEDVCEEIWEWDGDHLNTITKHFYYYEYGNLVEEEIEIARFFYENDRISTIRIGNKRYELSYQNNLLSSVICYDLNDNPNLEYHYEYNGSVLTKVSLSVPSLTFLDEFYLEWLEGNVAIIKYHYNGNYVSSYTFTYDNKENPFFNLCVNYHDNLEDPDCFIERFLLPSSKNNVISGHWSGGWPQTNIIYTYDGDYPTSRKRYCDGDVIITTYEYQE